MQTQIVRKTMGGNDYGNSSIRLQLIFFSGSVGVFNRTDLPLEKVRNVAEETSETRGKRFETA